MKKYRKWIFTIIGSLIIYIGLSITITFFLDPYREYSLFNFNFNKYKFALSYNTFPFVLYEKLKNDDYILVFGTSRSQLINSNIVGENLLNYSSSLYGNPIDVYNYLKQMNQTSVKHIKEIWYLVDTHTFVNKTSLYEKISLNSYNDFVFQTIENFNFRKLTATWDMITLNLDKKFSYYLTADGENIKLKDNIYFNGNIDNTKFYRVATYDKNAIQFLKKIDTWCKINSIKIIYFTSVYNLPYLHFTNLEQYKHQFSKFLTAVDGIYDFHYVEGVSNNLRNFTDIDHLNTRGTKQLVQLLKVQNKKYFLNKANLTDKYKSLLDRIKNTN